MDIASLGSECGYSRQCTRFFQRKLLSSSVNWGRGLRVGTFGIGVEQI